MLSRNGGIIGAHRYSYELAYGPIPDGLCCCHRCDNPQCINPEHLFLGTRSDNLQDAVRKGRMAHGETQGNSKLTEVDVRAIREDKVSTGSILGEKYGVHPNTIYAIKKGLTWKHVICPSGVSA